MSVVQLSFNAMARWPMLVVLGKASDMEVGMATCENKLDEWFCLKCDDFIHPQQVTFEELHTRCGERVEWKYFCGKPAVICYDGRNLCAECADPNVLVLYRVAERASQDGVSAAMMNRMYEAWAALTAPEDS